MNKVRRNSIIAVKNTYIPGWGLYCWI